MGSMREEVEATLKSMGLTIESDGKHYVHTTKGRYAPVVHTVITLDEDGTGATIISMLDLLVEPGKRSAVCELLNMVHGQGLWNMRFHLDDDGRVLNVGKFSLWGRPFNGVQFGDIVFSLLVTADRLYPCMDAITRQGKPAAEAFGLFFLRKEEERPSS